MKALIVLILATLPLLISCEKNDAIGKDQGVTSNSEKSLYSLSKIESDLLNMFLEEDLSGISEGRDTLSGDSMGYTRVRAEDVAQVYLENEIQGDLKFKGKKLLVVGVVSDITSDFRNNPAVTFEGNNQFLEPIASVIDSDVQRIASLRKGDRIVLFCVGGGEITGRPIFGECEFPDRLVSEFRNKITLEVREYLIGNLQSQDRFERPVIASIAVSSLISQGKISCKNIDKECFGKIVEFAKNNKAGLDASLNSARNALRQAGLSVSESSK